MKTFCRWIIYHLLFLNVACCQLSERVNVNFDSNQDAVSQEDIFESVSLIIPDNPGEKDLMPQGRYCLAYGKDYIFILDLFSDYAIHVFDCSGKYLEKLNYQGNELGKYKLAYDLLVDEEAGLLVVLDPTGKIIRYALSDSFSFYDELSFNEVINAAHNIGLLAKDVYGLYSLSAEKALYVCSFPQKTITPIRNYSVPIWLRVSPFMFSPLPPFYSFQGQAYYYDRLNGNVYKIHHNTLVPFMRWNLGNYQMDMKEIAPEKSLNYYVDLLQKSSYRHVVPFYNIVETERYVFANYMFRNQQCTLLYDKVEKRSKTFHRTTEGKRFVLGNVHRGVMFVLIPWEQIPQYVDEYLVPNEKSNNYVILKYILR